LGTRFAENPVEEIPPGVYCMKVEILLDSLLRGEYNIDSIIEKIPWQDECLLALSSFRRTFDKASSGINPGSNSVEKTHALIQILRESVLKRCLSVEYHLGTDNNPQMLGKSKYMVLFSGGVDSTLVAALMHSVLPAKESIDLCSICFAKGSSPDRLSAIDAFQELKETCNGREWRFIEINSSYDEVQDSLSHLLEILFPCDTVMDFNIGGALWMASNGVGSWVDYLPSENGGHRRLMIDPVYHSRARTVFMGHGADELFGGYGRHRTKFRNFGLPGLSEELRLDIRRLWKRNFGRDDRVISDHGKEARLPFMDEEVIRFALETDLEVLVDLNLPLGEGDKIILRNCLRILGLGRTAARQKRALQFGSRLAKAANEAQFGGTRKANQHFAGKVRLSEVPLANITSQSLED
jgi:asparagine synthetase B (glutamine-hydrolysing)